MTEGEVGSGGREWEQTTRSRSAAFKLTWSSWNCSCSHESSSLTTPTSNAAEIQNYKPKPQVQKCKQFLMVDSLALVEAPWSRISRFEFAKAYIDYDLPVNRIDLPRLRYRPYPRGRCPASQGSNVALRKWSLLPPCFHSMMCQGLVCRDPNRRLVAPRQSLQPVTPLWPGNIETFYPVFVFTVNLAMKFGTEPWYAAV